MLTPQMLANIHVWSLKKCSKTSLQVYRHFYQVTGSNQSERQLPLLIMSVHCEFLTSGNKLLYLSKYHI